MSGKPLPPELEGKPTCRLTLGPTPGSTGLTQRTAVLWVSADTLYALKLSPGCCALVAIAREDGEQPRKLLDLYRERFDIQSPPESAECLGDFAVVADVWPDPKLQANTAAASPLLHDALGKPDAQSTILMYKQESEVSEPPAQWQNLVLQICIHQPTDDTLLPAVQGLLSSDTKPLASSSTAVTPPAVSKDRRGRPPPRVLSPAMKGAKTTSTPGSTPKSVKMQLPRPKAVNLTQANAVLRALHESGSQSKLRDIITLLLKNQIGGQRVLPGNLFIMPVLGMSVLFRIDDASVASDSAAFGMVGPDTAISFVRAQDGALPITVDSYAAAAAEAATADLGGGNDGAAAMAALHAAQMGESSIGTTYNDLGGSQSQISALHELVTVPLQANSVFSRYYISPPKGVLLHGPPGTGKTALARAAATESRAKLFVINGPDVVSEYFGESESGIKGVFAAARALAPSVIFIDEVDAIAPARDGPSGTSRGNNASSRLVTTLLTEMDHLQGYAVIVLAATNRLDAVDSGLRRPGRFDREIEVDVPSPMARRDILTLLVNRMHTTLSHRQVLEIANSAHGFVGADLAALCSEAAMVCLRRLAHCDPCSNISAVITREDFRLAEARVRPSGLRQVILEVPKVSWNDIGGLEDIKQQLREAVEWPFKSPDMLRKLGAKPPRGILLFGPPGCSKTLIARAVAAESGLNFFSVKGPELYSKYVGESEKALATLFKKARSSSPAIVFFDEIDGLVTSRAPEGGGGVDVSDRVLSQLLQEMDGLQGDEQKAVVIVAATNRPDSIDTALLRPGRFDRLLYVPPPDATTRKAIFAVHARKMPLASDVDLTALAAATVGYTGADISAICQQAGYLALEEDADVQELRNEHFIKAARAMPPSAAAIDQGTKESYERFLRQCTASMAAG